MMQRYSSSQGQCYSCGLFHHHSQSCNSSFSMVFSMQNGGGLDQTTEYPLVSSSSSSSSVDCTLSLGTPSTRLCEEDEKRRRSNSFCMSNFWDLVHNKNSTKSAPCVPPYSHNKTSRSGNSGSGNDPLLARRCANCDTTSTPLWRNGPRGPKSLCNACGIRFKKEERRTTAANSVAGSGNTPGLTEQYHHTSYNYQNAAGTNSWVHHAQAQRVPCYSPNEFRFMDDVSADHPDSDNGSAIPFRSWRLNVADRASLVHDSTR